MSYTDAYPDCEWMDFETLERFMVDARFPRCCRIKWMSCDNDTSSITHSPGMHKNRAGS